MGRAKLAASAETGKEAFPMAWGVNYYGKKAAQLVKHEHELLIMLKEGGDAEQTRVAAEEVRAGHIRVLKSRAAQLAQSEKCAKEFARLEEEMARWAAIPVEDILAAYGEKAAKGRVAFVRRHRRGGR
jgi:hypothetical protein